MMKGCLLRLFTLYIYMCVCVCTCVHVYKTMCTSILIIFLFHYYTCLGSWYPSLPSQINLDIDNKLRTHNEEECLGIVHTRFQKQKVSHTS